jgi:hypothetical protein
MRSRKPVVQRTANSDSYRPLFVVSTSAPLPPLQSRCRKNGASVSEADVLEFMKEVVPWLEAQDWITGYASFPFTSTSPVGAPSARYGEGGLITVLGE